MTPYVVNTPHVSFFGPIIVGNSRLAFRVRLDCRRQVEDQAEIWHGLLPSPPWSSFLRFWRPRNRSFGALPPPKGPKRATMMATAVWDANHEEPVTRKPVGDS
jgi:hypothetical protein